MLNCHAVYGVPTGRIKLALNIVASVSSQTGPAWFHHLAFVRRIEAIRQQDTNQIADQVTIVEVIPNEDLCPQIQRTCNVN